MLTMIGERILVKFVAAFLLVQCLPAVLGGSACPAKEEIEPCTCATVPQPRRHSHTTIICSGIKTAKDLAKILPRLRAIEIDRFLLQGSLWRANAAQKFLPADFLTLLRASEFEIQNSNLDPSFACRAMRTNGSCINENIKSFKVVNGSPSNHICTLFDKGFGDKIPWTMCLKKLESFQFSHGRLDRLSDSLFAKEMPELKSLNLTFNRIATIHDSAFRNLPQIKSIDLSHNALASLSKMFSTSLMKNLQILDVSFNAIKTIGDDFLGRMPTLRFLNLKSNYISELIKGHWNKRPDSLLKINLKNNPLHCDCEILWINSTIPKKVSLQGTCSTPPHYKHSYLRQAVTGLKKKCKKSAVHKITRTSLAWLRPLGIM